VARLATIRIWFVILVLLLQEFYITLTGNPNPTFWLNHNFFLNNIRVGRKERPLNFHRFGGLGSHRYPIGFSGDVVPDWASLEFQPYFTATAANVLFGYWRLICEIIQLFHFFLISIVMILVDLLFNLQTNYTPDGFK